MGRRRAALTLIAAAALAAGGAIVLAGRMDWRPALVIPVVSALGTLVLIAALGPARGGAVALILMATVQRYPADIAGASLKPEHIAAPIVALALAPSVLRLVRRLRAVDWLLLAWLAWSVAGGLLNAPDPGNSTKLWVMLLLVAFPYFVVVTTLTTAGRLRLVVDAWLLTAIAAGIFGIATHILYAWDIDLGIQINPVTADPSVPATFWEANLFGSAMMAVFLVCVSLLVLGHPLSRLTIAAAVVSALGVQVSLTRTAWIALVGGLLVLAGVRAAQAVWGKARPEMRSLRPVGTLAAGVAAGTLLLWLPIGDSQVAAERDQRQATAQALIESQRATQTASAATESEATQTAESAPPLLFEGTPTEFVVPTRAPENPDIVGRLGSIGDPNDSSVRIRLRFARQGIADWKEHPIAGNGVGSFGQRYTTSSSSRAWLSNVFVRVLHDSGAVGFALFIAPLAILAWQTRRLAPVMSSNLDRMALALGIAVAAMFIAFQATEGFQLAWYWIVLGLFAAAVRLAGDRHRAVS